MSKCKARQHSDQMICHECGLIWGMNDPEPPECAPKKRTQVKRGAIEHIRRMITK